MKAFDTSIPLKDRIFNSWMFYMYGLVTMGLVILITAAATGCCTAPSLPEPSMQVKYVLLIIKQKLMELQTWGM
jgi:hypothetical protein